jgi:hypothetical protein
LPTVSDLTEPERRLWDAFARGTPVDLGGGDPTVVDASADDWDEPQRVRAEVIARLLLGAVAAEPGHTPRLALAGARITGAIDLSGGTVTCELRLTRCWLDEPLDASDAKLGNVTLQACRVGRADLWAADVDGSVRLTGSLIGELNLGGAHIGGRLHLSGATISNPDGLALAGTRLVVDHSMICGSTTVNGELRLLDATIGTALILAGATLSNPGGRALNAGGLTVEQSIYCTQGFRATGEMRFHRARIRGPLMLDGTIDGVLDLRDAQLYHLVVPSSLPAPARLDGLTYQHLAPEELEGHRIRWLQRDPDGYRAQPYEQLADYYRRLGYDRRARMVLLAKRRMHCRRLPLRWRLVSWFQDALSGYGYAPGRAVGWLVAVWAAGAAYFAAWPPAGDGSGYHAALYALDVVLPTSPLRLEGEFTPEGAGFWLAIGLQMFGWALSIAVLPALTRALSRS